MTPLTAEEKARLRKHSEERGFCTTECDGYLSRNHDDHCQFCAAPHVYRLLDAYEALEKELRHEKGRWPEDEKPIVIITQDEDGDFIARDITRPGLLIHADHEAGALGKLLETRTDYDQLAKEAGLIREGD